MSVELDVWFSPGPISAGLIEIASRTFFVVSIFASCSLVPTDELPAIKMTSRREDRCAMRAISLLYLISQLVPINRSSLDIDQSSNDFVSFTTQEQGGRSSWGAVLAATGRIPHALKLSQRERSKPKK